MDMKQIETASRLRHLGETLVMIEGMAPEVQAVAAEVALMSAYEVGFLHGVATERLAQKQAAAKE